MRQLFKKLGKKKFAVPGSIDYLGESTSEPVELTLFTYNQDQMQEQKKIPIPNNGDFILPNQTNWINVDGLHDTELIKSFGTMFSIHSLALEDIVNTSQRPKWEDYDGFHFFVIPMLQFNTSTNQIESEQISIILKENMVITFQEKKGDVFEKIRDRIRFGYGKIRKMKADYLLYSILDAVVDHYFLMLEKINDQLEELEDALFENPDQKLLRDLHQMRSELIFLRKAVWPLRDIFHRIIQEDTSQISKKVQLYLRDLYDHVSQTIETIQSFRDMLSSLLDLYLNTVSNKMNEIMKVLTVFAAIFIPLTFLAGVYGMNFEFMPELQYRFSYPIWWLVCIIVFVALLYFFKKKKWF